ncbi:MAG TPA: hypothetical protein VMW40_05415 [Candidatus Bathyarchaeia archaeon]|nr:hypothetical protein [Candidatus Bathyarchaeia archaeon]
MPVTTPAAMGRLCPEIVKLSVTSMNAHAPDETRVNVPNPSGFIRI